MSIVYKLILVISLLLLPINCLATDWYVDNAASGGNDGTSWTDAWESFSDVVWDGAGVVAGDSLYISGGAASKTYTATVGWPSALLLVDVSGTSGNEIIITTGAKSSSPSGHAGKVIFDGDGSYAPLIKSFESFITFDGEKDGVINWELYNIPMTEDNNAMMLSGGAQHDGNTITYIRMHDCANGVYAPFGKNLEISYCDIHDITDDFAIRVIANADNVLGSISIHHCDITTRTDPTNNWSGPDGIQGTYAIDVYNNTFLIENAPTVGSQHPDHIQADFHLNRYWNNYFLGGGSAQIFPNWTTGPAAIDDFVIYNNTFVSSGWVGIVLKTAAGQTTAINRCYVVNNTFVDTNGNMAFQFIIAAATATVDITIENNIFYNCGSPSPTYQVGSITATETQQGGISFDYNLLNAGNSGLAAFYWIEPGWDAIVQANGQTGAPAFVDYAENSLYSNLHLASGDTAAKENGTSQASVFTTDLDGVTRPQSTNWDIGAYEYYSGIDDTPPVISNIVPLPTVEYPSTTTTVTITWDTDECAVCRIGEVDEADEDDLTNLATVETQGACGSGYGTQFSYDSTGLNPSDSKTYYIGGEDESAQANETASNEVSAFTIAASPPPGDRMTVVWQ